jgi:hypothetical protein
MGLQKEMWLSYPGPTTWPLVTTEYRGHAVVISYLARARQPGL